MSFPFLPPYQYPTGNYAKVLRREDQATQQITRGSEDKMINSDQDPISFCETIFSKKIPIYFRQTQVSL